VGYALDIVIVTESTDGTLVQATIRVHTTLVWNVGLVVVLI
jgi:hypothetical protein